MSHQPFETWLLSEEPLETEQVVALQAHLESCEACRNLSTGWAEVRDLFVHSKPIGPAPGFSARWQARLLAHQADSRYALDQEESVLFIGVTAGITLLLMFTILASGIAIFDSPSQVLMTGLYSLGNLINSLNAVENIFGILSQVLPRIVPTPGWIILTVLAGSLILVWTYLLRKILLPRRVTL